MVETPGTRRSSATHSRFQNLSNPRPCPSASAHFLANPKTSSTACKQNAISGPRGKTSNGKDPTHKGAGSGVKNSHRSKSYCWSQFPGLPVSHSPSRVDPVPTPVPPIYTTDLFLALRREPSRILALRRSGPLEKSSACLFKKAFANSIFRNGKFFRLESAFDQKSQRNQPTR